MTATGNLDPLHILLLAGLVLALANTPLHWR